MMDEITRKELAEVIGSAIAAASRSQNERFVTGNRLCEMFQMFTPYWIKTYGHLLPRIKAEVINETGKSFRTGWAYNVQAIQKMIDKDELVFRSSECVYKPARKREVSMASQHTGQKTKTN